MQKRIREYDFDKRPAGQRADIFQMNIDATKDRLGANGLVNKGLIFGGVKKPALTPMKTIDFRKTSLTHDLYSKKWVHNDADKPHHYFSKSFSENMSGGGQTIYSKSLS